MTRLPLGPILTVFIIAVLGGCGPVDPGVVEGVGVLNEDVYKGGIQTILDQRGCSNTGCHYRDKTNPSDGGPGGSFRIFNCTNDSCSEDQLLANYDSASGMSNLSNPADSKLLLKPLAEAAGGLQHLGGDIFLDASDTGYIALLNWIQSPL